MADIFLSYASEDRERIVPLARLLESCGWSVFWDRKTPIGVTWDEYLATNLEVSRCVVVAWSTHSVTSPWVKEEAHHGKERNALVPLLLEPVKPPFGFRQIQAADLSDWRGDAEHRELGDLVAHLRNLLNQARMTTPSAERNELPLEPAITSADAKFRADQAPKTREQQPSASSSAKPESPAPGKPPATDAGSENLKPGIRAPAVWLGLAAAVGILAVLWFTFPRTGVREQAGVEVLPKPPPAVIAKPPNTTEGVAPEKAKVAPAASGEKQTVASPPATKREFVAGERFRDPLKGGGEAPEMVVIPAGSFLMGSPADEAKKSNGERPRHEVTIARPFALARYEVTFAEYDAFSKATGRELPADEGWGRGNRPVIYVSWQDAQDYAQWLSEQTGKHYRLPTEAEWEYAARAGTTTSRYWGDTASDACRYANVDDATHGCKDGQEYTAPVGSYEANAFGVHDMLGNVVEWTEDCWHENYNGAPEDGSAWTQGGDCNLRVVRGGNWFLGPRNVRSATRYRYSPDSWVRALGFRLAQDLE